MPNLPRFRELFNDISQYKGHSLFQDVLARWLGPARFAVDELQRRFSRFAPSNCKDEGAQLAMWNMYALSRVNDLLLLSFQSARREKSPSLSFGCYEDFFSDLGFSVVLADAFTPFHHEVAHVEQAKSHDDQIQLLEHRWPGLMLGELMFSRSGVAVTGGRNNIAKEVAEHSTLYFAFCRQNRRTHDLSVGWGSNSQWRTDFRRDYESGGKRIYNADGKNLLNEPARGERDRDGLTEEERIELCKHRCFIVTPNVSDDLWPFDDRFEEPCS
jgi:hypothetical protein